MKTLDTTPLLRRFASGNPFGIECNSGWNALLLELDRSISTLAPDYMISQVKQKFGGLRFYIFEVPRECADEVYALIRVAEEESIRTCELCGDPGELGSNSRAWLSVRCSDCAPDVWTPMPKE